MVLLYELYYLLDKPTSCLNYHQRLFRLLNLLLPPVVGGYGEEVYAGREFLFEETLRQVFCLGLCGCCDEDYRVHIRTS